MKEPSLVVCAAVRTAIGIYSDTLKDMPAPDLRTAVIKAVLEEQ